MSDDVGDIIRQYLICRDGLKILADTFKKDRAKYDTAMKNMETKLLGLANAQGVNSFNTEYGTALKSHVFKIKVTDWPLALEFILANDLTHMFTKSVAKESVVEYAEANNGQLPPGLEKMPWVNLNVRRK